MTVELILNHDIEGSTLTNVTHVSLEDGEYMFHHDIWTLAIPTNAVESMVIRGD